MYVLHLEKTLTICKLFLSHTILPISMINPLFLDLTATEPIWIPVQSAVGGENTLRPKNQDQSINKTIHLVEKALKIGVPSFCIMFIGTFTVIGFWLNY